MAYCMQARRQEQTRNYQAIDRAYIKHEIVYVTSAEAPEAEKAANRKAPMLAKEQKAKKAKKHPEAQRPYREVP